MSTFVIKGRPVWVGELDLSCVATNCAIDYGAEAVDSTALCDTTRVSIGGLKTFGFSMDAYTDFDVVDGILHSNVGQAVPVTFATVAGVEQEGCYLVKATQLVHSPFGGAIGDMAATNISGNAAGELVSGILEVNRATAATGTSTGYQLGAVSATERLFANLHVIAAAGTTLDVVVESDDNPGFTTPVTRMTFTQATGITSEQLTLAGSVTDDYWRVSYTISGGSFTFVLGFGIL